MAKGLSLSVLRQKLERAVGSGDTEEALLLLDQLEQLQAWNPQWPHRRGDVLKAAGRLREAVKAYERAMDQYTETGNVARAVAMAKAISQIFPSRADIFEKVDPEPAREVHRKARIPGATTGQGQLALLRPRIQESAQEEERNFDEVSEKIEVDIELSELDLRARPKPPPSHELEARAVETLALMPLFPLLAEAPRPALRMLAEGAELLDFDDEEIVVELGDPADSLFAIVEGAAGVKIPAMEGIVWLGEGDVFGESCLLEGERRRATVWSVGRLTCLRIPSSVLSPVLREFAEVGDLLFELLARRLVSNLMQTSPLFAPFEPEARGDLCGLFEIHRVPKGTILVQTGKPSRGLFIPLTGAIEVEGGDRVGPGALLGHGSLLAHGPSRYTARAQSDLAVLLLPDTAFATLASQYPPVLAQLSELSSDSPAVLDRPALL